MSNCLPIPMRAEDAKCPQNGKYQLKEWPGNWLRRLKEEVELNVPKDGTVGWNTSHEHFILWHILLKVPLVSVNTHLICLSCVNVVMAAFWLLFCCKVEGIWTTLPAAGCEITIVLYSGAGSVFWDWEERDVCWLWPLRMLCWLCCRKIMFLFIRTTQHEWTDLYHSKY